jgi:hypothetical protein
MLKGRRALVSDCPDEVLREHASGSARGVCDVDDVAEEPFESGLAAAPVGGAAAPATVVVEGSCGRAVLLSDPAGAPPSRVDPNVPSRDESTDEPVNGLEAESDVLDVGGRSGDDALLPAPSAALGRLTSTCESRRRCSASAPEAVGESLIVLCSKKQAKKRK